MRGMRQTRHREIGLLGERRGRVIQAFGHEVVPNKQQQLFLGEGDPGLSNHAGSLEPRERDVCADQQRFPRNPFYQLSCKLAELDMLAAFVLEHGLLHELLDVSTAEQRQLANDLTNGAGPRQTHQSLTGQSSDLICICNGHLYCQERQQHLQDRHRMEVEH